MWPEVNGARAAEAAFLGEVSSRRPMSRGRLRIDMSGGVPLRSRFKSNAVRPESLQASLERSSCRTATTRRGGTDVHGGRDLSTTTVAPHPPLEAGASA